MSNLCCARLPRVPEPLTYFPWRINLCSRVGRESPVVGENQACHLILWGWGWWGQWQGASNFTLSRLDSSLHTHISSATLQAQFRCFSAALWFMGNSHGNTNPYMPRCMDWGSSVLRAPYICQDLFVCCCLLLNSLCPWNWCLLILSLWF